MKRYLRSAGTQSAKSGAPKDDKKPPVEDRKEDICTASSSRGPVTRSKAALTNQTSTSSVLATPSTNSRTASAGRDSSSPAKHPQRNECHQHPSTPASLPASPENPCCRICDNELEKRVCRSDANGHKGRPFWKCNDHEDLWQSWADLDEPQPLILCFCPGNPPAVRRLAGKYAEKPNTFYYTCSNGKCGFWKRHKLADNSIPVVDEELAEKMRALGF